MLQKKTIEKIIPILRKDLNRALRINIPGFPSPHYCSFLLRDTHWFNTWASSGSVYRVRSDHTRNVYADLRVGNIKYDQVTHGGLRDNDDERESYNHVNVPIDDTYYDGLRLGLWRLIDAKYREAVADYKEKEVSDLSKSGQSDRLKAMKRLRKVEYKKFEAPEKVNEDKWERFCKNASKWMSSLPHISASWVEFDTNQITKIFVNSERRLIVHHEQVFSLSATFRKLLSDGTHLDQEFVLNAGTQLELPTMREFKKIAMERYERLVKLSRAKKIHAFSGPVLLMPGPAGLLFHEAIGHRLEGSRMLSSSEGQTFKGHVGQKVLNVEVTIRDNPKIKKWGGKKCIGAYEFDDEGTPALDTLLIENGVLKDFLNTRIPLAKGKFTPNGHARNRKFERPISRMAVTTISTAKPTPCTRLREMLIREIKRQRKPFGLIVYEANSGETETESYDFQGFLGFIAYATIVYPDGREVPVRGVNFVGTPLQALNNIIAVGDDLELINDYCGAESGIVPISTISPSVLLSNLELQTKEEEIVTQYVLPKPKLGE
jgi:TldD protein